MTMRAIRRLVAAMVIMSVPFVLGSCGEDKEKQAEIERLNEKIEGFNERLKDSREDSNRLGKENDELRDSIREEKAKSRELKSQLSSAERDLERARKREEREEERAKAVATAKKRPGSKEQREKIKEEVSAKLGALAEIKGDRTSGTGFVVASDEKVWIYCAASTLAGNSKLEIKQTDGGRLEQFGDFEVAAGVDLARLELKNPPENKLEPGEAVEIASGAALFGVSDVGVLVEGRSYEPKASELKADARIGRCPPGSPVFHGDTGTLLGVVAEALDAKRDLWREEDSYSRPQRIVFRLDRAVEWQAMPIGTFLGEARTIEEADGLTRLVQAFAVVQPDASGVSLDASLGSGQTAREIIEDNRSEPAVGALFDLKKWLEEKKGKASETDVKKRIKSVYTQITRASGTNTRELESKKFSAFHQAAAKQSLDWRKEAQDKLGETLKRIDE